MRPTYVRPKRDKHVPAGSGEVEHSDIVAAAVERCRKAGVEFWALAPAPLTSWGVRTDDTGMREYVRVNRYGRATAVTPDGSTIQPEG
jgi:hypothetical protein